MPATKATDCTFQKKYHLKGKEKRAWLLRDESYIYHAINLKGGKIILLQSCQL